MELSFFKGIILTFVETRSSDTYIIYKHKEMEAKYKRVLLKLSGESLMGKQGYGIDTERLSEYASQIMEICSMGVQVAIVIGGGNIFRGLSGAAKGFNRVKGDQMGMLATVINSLALSSALESIGQPAKVLTALNMYPIGDYYSNRVAIEALQRGEVAIIAGGTGNPFSPLTPEAPCAASRLRPM